MPPAVPYQISVVVPVYAGQHSLAGLMGEIARIGQAGTTPDGHVFAVHEVLLVHDCGPDQSASAIEALAKQYPFIRPVWLSRNFGQHAATMAGMASATGDWVATLDEDGQHNPADLPRMLDHALRTSSRLVYAKPTNPAPHGPLRNLASHLAKEISRNLLGNTAIQHFNSFRLMDGEVARTVAAYASHGVYLDVGLYWITGSVGHCPVVLREESGRPSGYSLAKLLGHFWSLVLTTGTRPLRLITIVGGISMLAALLLTSFILYRKLTGQIEVQGWASLLIIVSFFSGTILVALGIIAEYLAKTMGIVMGRPLYVVSSRAVRPQTLPRLQPRQSPQSGPDIEPQPQPQPHAQP